MFDSLRGGDQTLVYTVSTFPFYGKNAGYFGVLTQTTMANLPKVEEVIQQNLKRLKDELVPETELDKGQGDHARRTEARQADAGQPGRRCGP